MARKKKLEEEKKKKKKSAIKHTGSGTVRELAGVFRIK